MTKTLNTPLRLIFTVAALLGVAPALAGPNPNSYLKGTYLVVYSDATPEGDQLVLTFDGAGNASSTDIANNAGVISTFTTTATYNVAGDGSFTADAGINTLSGRISADGNVIVLTKLASGSTPCILVGVKQDLVGNFNVASGIGALASDTTGTANSALGDLALAGNTSGANNTAFGYQALFSNTTGRGNAAQGVNALVNNTTGIRNLGIGNNAMFGNTTGSYNIGLGFEGGYNITTGSYNIEIGAEGTASDNNTIQIGVPGTQTSTTIAGISGSPVTGSAVFVDSTGKLGVQVSSERFKADIAAMPEVSSKLEQLRPVTFHYKSDPQGVSQYGLIAEEVDRVSPELVIRDAQGKIQGVHYEELAPMLLKELQTQRATIESQSATIASQGATIESQAVTIASQAAKIDDVSRQVAELNALKQEMSDMRAALSRPQPTDDLVAQR